MKQTISKTALKTLVTFSLSLGSAFCQTTSTSHMPAPNIMDGGTTQIASRAQRSSPVPVPQCVTSQIHYLGGRVSPRTICLGDEIATLTQSLFYRGFVLGNVSAVNPASGEIRVSVPGRGNIDLNLFTSGREIKTGFEENFEGTIHTGGPIEYCDVDYPYSRVRDYEMSCGSAEIHGGHVEKIFRNPYTWTDETLYTCKGTGSALYTDCQGKGGIGAAVRNIQYSEDAPLYLIRTASGRLIWKHLVYLRGHRPQLPSERLGTSILEAFRTREVAEPVMTQVELLSDDIYNRSSPDMLRNCATACFNNLSCNVFTAIVGGPGYTSRCKLFRHADSNTAVRTGFNSYVRGTYIYTGIRLSLRYSD